MFNRTVTGVVKEVKPNDAKKFCSGCKSWFCGDSCVRCDSCGCSESVKKSVTGSTCDTGVKRCSIRDHNV